MEKPTSIQLDQQQLENLQKAKGNVILVRGHVIEGKLTITGIQHIMQSAYAHNWPGGSDSAFAHNWPSSSES